MAIVARHLRRPHAIAVNGAVSNAHVRHGQKDVGRIQWFVIALLRADTIRADIRSQEASRRTMMRLVHVLLVTLLTLLPAQAFAGPAEDAGVVIDRWAAALSANDIDALLTCFAPDSLMQGLTSAKLVTGREAIGEYFRAAPENGVKVTISERHMVVLSDSAVMGVGLYRFGLLQDGIMVPRAARFTFVMVKHGNDWAIAHLHASALPPAPLQ